MSKEVVKLKPNAMSVLRINLTYDKACLTMASQKLPKFSQIFDTQMIFHHRRLDVSGSVAGGALDGGVRRCRYSAADTVPSCPTLYRAGAVQTEPVPLYNLYGPCVS